MIRHIVFFTARDQADLDRIREGWKRLGKSPTPAISKWAAICMLIN